MEEHRRLFSFAPSKASRRCKGKTPRAKRPKRGPSIDGAIYSGFPKLIDAEGYKLMRLSDVGQVLVDIIVPEGGMTVPYVKDIVRQARLYVSPGKSIPLDRDKVHVHKIECRVSGVTLFHHANF